MEESLERMRRAWGDAVTAAVLALVLALVHAAVAVAAALQAARKAVWAPVEGVWSDAEGCSGRVPLHVGLSLEPGEARRHPLAVARLVAAAFRLGVRTVSVFDARGVVAAHAGKRLASDLLSGAGPAAAADGKAAATAADTVRVLCPAEADAAGTLGKGGGGAAAPRCDAPGTVWVLGASDAFERVADAARRAAAVPGAAAALRSRPALLRACAGGPPTDPELVIVAGAGDGRSLLGFPPWLLRSAELAWVPSLRGAGEADMAAALRAYQRTEQRFGR